MSRAVLSLLLASVLVGAAASPPPRDRELGLLEKNHPTVAKGMRAYEEGRYEDALAAFEAARRELPASPVLDHNIGNAHYKLGRYEEAEKAWLRATSSAADDKALRQKGFFNLGNAYAAQEKDKEAIGMYRKALALNPSDAEARHNLEVLLRKIPPRSDDTNQTGPDGGTDGGQDGGTDGGNPDGGQDGGTDGGAPDAGQDGGQQDGGQGDGGTPDGGSDAGQPQDGGQSDGGEEDGGNTKGDAGPPDGGGGDGGSDGGSSDGGSADAGADGGSDSNRGDGGFTDGGAPDAGPQDGGQGDASSQDGGTPDAGAPDAGSQEGSQSGESSADGGQADEVSRQEAENLLDSMRQNEKNHQLWRFQQPRKPRPGNDKDW